VKRGQQRCARHRTDTVSPVNRNNVRTGLRQRIDILQKRGNAHRRIRKIALENADYRYGNDGTRRLQILNTFNTQRDGTRLLCRQRHRRHNLRFIQWAAGNRLAGDNQTTLRGNVFIQLCK